MESIIEWFNDKTNKKLTSLILIFVGISSVISALALYQSGALSVETVLSSIAISFIVRSVLAFLIGIIFLILGIRLWGSAK